VVARPLSTAWIVGNITKEKLTTVPSQTPTAVAKMKRPMGELCHSPEIRARLGKDVTSDQ
jgi:hypothetical protein